MNLSPWQDEQPDPGSTFRVVWHDNLKVLSCAWRRDGHDFADLLTWLRIRDWAGADVLAGAENGT